MIEIYGIPEELHKCYSCVNATRFLDMIGKEYKFIPVLRKADTSVGFDYNKDDIKTLAKRAGFASLAITYPQIFIDGKHIGGYKDLREHFA